MIVRRRICRLRLVLALLAPFLYIGAASAGFVYRNRASNSPRRAAPLLPLPSLRPEDRLLVISPHPDDETLACGGLIQQAVEAGAQVRVLVLTNGDGFRVAAETAVRKLRVGPADYLRLGEQRQSETRSALRRLGLSGRSVEFLGYPDGGLDAMWRDHWAPDRPYRSWTTGRLASADRTRAGSAPYAGESLLRDLRATLRAFRPTLVALPHPLDDHPDHAAACAFATLAIWQEEGGASNEAGCRLLHYIVHRGDWPSPMALRRDDALPPPAQMRATDTRWRSLELTPRQVERKLAAIGEYASQTAVMARFMKAFARRTECYGEIRVPRAAALTDAPPSVAWPENDRWAWLRDPVSDNVVRDFEGGADIEAVGAARDESRLYLQVVTQEPLPRALRVRIHLRYFGDPKSGCAGGSYELALRTPRGVTPADLEARSASHGVQVAIPLREIGYARRVAARVETVYAGVRMDNTGYRFFDL